MGLFYDLGDDRLAHGGFLRLFKQFSLLFGVQRGSNDRSHLLYDERQYRGFLSFRGS